MNSIKNLLTTTTALAAAALLLCGSRAVTQAAGLAPDQAIGVSFVFDTNNVGGVGLDSIADSLLPTEVAGVYAQSNWNNCGRYGSGSFVLTNNPGNPVPLTMNWDSGWVDQTGAAAGLGTPDGKLMNGFLYSWNPGAASPLANSIYGCSINNKPLVYVSNLVSWYNGLGAEGYAVVLYTVGYLYWETGEGWVQSVSGSPLNNTMVEGPDLSPHKYAVENTAFTGTYTPVVANPTFGGNYMFFTGFTNDAVILRLQSGGYGAGLNGFQLIPVFPTPPTANTPTFNPGNTVFAGVPVTLSEAADGDPFHPEFWYQWQSDFGMGGPLTDMTNATNSTVTVTPTNNVATYTVNYQVIVTNIFGASTSAVVTLTVNPAVAPYVTQDTIPGAGNAVSTAYSYVGGSITFNAAFGGTQPITYNWQSNSVDISGATSTNLTLANLQLGSAASYALQAANSVGSTTSTPAPLVVEAAPAAPTSASAYPYAVFTNGPAAYWRLTETLDTMANSVQAYDYSGNNKNATYGANATDNQVGPQSPALPGFEATNTGAILINNTANSFLTAPSLDLNTNTVTISAWINPIADQSANNSLFMWSNGGTKAGIRFANTNLGYIWNSTTTSSNFNSGLYPPVGMWSFVTLTITPTNSTIYLYYVDTGTSTTNLLKSVQSITNNPASFSGGTTWIGSDTTASRNFNGYIDEVSVFNKALSETQVQDLFLKALGATGVAPVFTQQPTNAIGPMFPWQEAQISAVAGAAPAPNYKWQSSATGLDVFSDLVNGGGVAGANTSLLSLSGNALATSMDYRVIAFNASGSATSTVSAVTLTPVPTNGLWTARYQFTNSSGFLWYDAYGSGSYSGRGVLGTGNFWNPIPGYGQWAGGNMTSVSGFMDDGSTPSGITCQFRDAGFSIAGGYTNYPSSDRRTLTTQFAYFFGYKTNGIVLSGVPNGTYNLALYGDAAPWNDRAASFVVHGQNGDQTAVTTNTANYQYFVNQENAVVVTNVTVSGGILNIDAFPTSPIPAHNPNTEFGVNAVEIQLVGYAPPTAGFSATPTNVFVTQSVTFTDSSTPVTNVFWAFGDGDTLSTTNGNVAHAYASPGTYTVSQTVTGPGGTASVTNTALITVVPKPVINSVTASGDSLVLSGTSGIAGAQYRILSSGNVALPLASWTPVWTNVFGAGGSYSYTNSPTTNPASFFILVSP